MHTVRTIHRHIHRTHIYIKQTKQIVHNLLPMLNFSAFAVLCPSSKTLTDEKADFIQKWLYNSIFFTIIYVLEKRGGIFVGVDDAIERRRENKIMNERKSEWAYVKETGNKCDEKVNDWIRKKRSLNFLINPCVYLCFCVCLLDFICVCVCGYISTKRLSFYTDRRRSLVII